MGLLRHLATGDTHRLRPRCRVGRVATADLRLDDARVSSEHAVIHYNGSGWEIRDLGSTNGTWVDKQRLTKGDRTILGEGSVLMFGGRAHTFELADASPPVASARQIRTGAVCVAAGGVLEIPDDQHPQLQLYEGLDGRWVMDSASEHRPVADREVVILDGEGWSLELPDLSSATLDTARVGPILETVTLRFSVSLDEEHIALTLVHDAGETSLGTRQYHLPLLLLARAWLADAGAPPEERGWVERETLCRGLSIDGGKLNVDIHRARKQLIGVGVLGAANLVMRRIDTGHLRLGVQAVEIEKGGVLEAPPPRSSRPAALPPRASPPDAAPQRSTGPGVASPKSAFDAADHAPREGAPDELRRDTAPESVPPSEPPTPEG